MVYKRILLINPPFYRLMGSHYNGLLLGLCYMTSVLKNQGYQVMIYNADFFYTEQYLKQEDIFRNYEEYKKTLTDLDRKIWGEIKANIEKHAPDVVDIMH